LPVSAKCMSDFNQVLGGLGFELIHQSLLDYTNCIHSKQNVAKRTFNSAILKLLSNRFSEVKLDKVELINTCNVG